MKDTMKSGMKPSGLLRPLVPAYAAAVGMKNRLYDAGLLPTQRLAWPVVSVGNLSVGGTGKTPMVGALAEMLQQGGWMVDVLSRGHGRQSQAVEIADPAGSAQRYGDEPLLLARSGLAVYVGRKRYDAGLLAEAQSPARNAAAGRALHLLDDGFQHRKLVRAVEIVLLDRSDLADRLLPAGRLREPLAALHRADMCVLREEDHDLIPQVMQAMQTQDPTRVWLQRRVVTLAAPLQKAVAFCGIGNAAQFFTSLRKAGISLSAEIAFRDHHAYSDRDVDALFERARVCQADGFVTTEKDSLRLEGELRETLEAVAPLHIPQLAVTLVEPARCLKQMERLLHLRAGVR